MKEEELIKKFYQNKTTNQNNNEVEQNVNLEVVIDDEENKNN